MRVLMTSSGPRADKLPELVTRLLHQIHFIAEQVPLDSTTYAMTSLLLSRVVELGGVGTESPQSEHPPRVGQRRIPLASLLPRQRTARHPRHLVLEGRIVA